MKLRFNPYDDQRREERVETHLHIVTSRGIIEIRACVDGVEIMGVDAPSIQFSEVLTIEPRAANVIHVRLSRKD